MKGGVFLRGFNFEKSILTTKQTLTHIDLAIKEGKPLSLSRFGIGELTYLFSGKIPLLVKHFERYKDYSGITRSEETIRQELIKALKTSDLTGLPPSFRSEFWANKTQEILKELNYSPSLVCSAWVMHDAVLEGSFWPWIKGKRAVIVGRRSTEAVPLFTQNGVTVAGAIHLEGYEGIAQAHSGIAKLPEWDIALVSAGIPATILVPRIAESTGKVAIDFGHALDMLMDGERYNHLKLVDDYNSEKD